jgi:hypothetical protein
MRKGMFFLIMLLMLLSACQGNMRDDADGTAYDLRTDRTAPNYMANRGNNPYNDDNDRAGTRDKDQHMVEDDITNQNPNFLNLQQTGSGSETGAGDQGHDIDKAKQVIADTGEFVMDSVWINGDRMWVTVYKKGTLSENEKIKAEARLHKILVKAIPRYHIEVRVQEDRR